MAKRKTVGAYKAVQQKTTVSGAISDAYSELQSLRDEMSETADNMQEKMSQTSKYQAVEEARDALDGFCDNEPDVPDGVSVLEVTYIEMVNRRKGRGPSRNTRCSNAVSLLEGVITAINAHAEDLEDGDDLKGEIETLADDLQEAVDSAGGVEFPGMYG